mgnify:CR=1 FL=1
MATRSAIAIEQGGEIYACYCHWDGYVEGVGETLLTHYQEAQKVLDLVHGGDISSLGPVIGKKHDFDQADPNTETTYYSRDRGETGVGFKVFFDRESFVKHYEGVGCEYFYFMDEDENWYVKKYNSGFTPLDYAVVHAKGELDFNPW